MSFETMTTTRCYTCDIQFSFPSDWSERRRQDRNDFYCPMGHSQHWTSKTDKEIIAEKERELSAVRTALYKANDDKEKMARKLKRVKVGVCPECNRSFENLKRHMASKHVAHKKSKRKA